MLGRYSVWPAGDVVDDPVPGAAEVVATRPVHGELDSTRGGDGPGRARGGMRVRAGGGGITAHGGLHAGGRIGTRRQHRWWDYGYSAAGAACGAPAGCVSWGLCRCTTRQPVGRTHAVPELCRGPWGSPLTGL